jgi:hypothetical protein
MSTPKNETADSTSTPAAETSGNADETPSNTDEDPDEDIRAHLADVADGCGCAEVWEHLSDGRGA